MTSRKKKDKRSKRKRQRQNRKTKPQQTAVQKNVTQSKKKPPKFVASNDKNSVKLQRNNTSIIKDVTAAGRNNSERQQNYATHQTRASYHATNPQRAQNVSEVLTQQINSRYSAENRYQHNNNSYNNLKANGAFDYNISYGVSDRLQSNDSAGKVQHERVFVNSMLKSHIIRTLANNSFLSTRPCWRVQHT